MSRSNFNWPLRTEVPNQGLVYGCWPWKKTCKDTYRDLHLVHTPKNKHAHVPFPHTFKYGRRIHRSIHTVWPMSNWKQPWWLLWCVTENVLSLNFFNLPRTMLGWTDFQQKVCIYVRVCLWCVLSACANFSQAAYVTDFLFHTEQCVGGGGLWVTRGVDKIILHPVNILEREAVDRKWLLSTLQGCRMNESVRNTAVTPVSGWGQG